MKKVLFLAVLAMMSVIPVMAQNEQFVSTEVSNKNVVLEEFTGVGCTWCPAGHAIANTLASNNPGRVFPINVHAGGFANSTYTTTNGNTLNSTFGVNSYPTGMVNRHTFSAGLVMGRGDWTSSANTILGQVSPVNIAARGTLDWTTRELTVTVQLYYTSNEANATNKLNVAILQDNVIGPQVGTSNNPSQVVGNLYRHMHMFRGYITGQWGDDITTTTAGSFVERTYTYTIPDFLGSPNAILAKIEDLHFIAFVAQGQQEILTGCEVEIENVNLPTLAARIDDLTYTEVRDCSTDGTAALQVSNTGSEDVITSLSFEYSVGSGAAQTYDWTGEILTGASASITLPTLLITPNSNQSISVRLTSINGQPFSVSYPNLTVKKIVVEGSGSMTLKIKTDGYASETSYKIYGPNNNVIQSSSSFTNSTVHEFPFVPTEEGCYRIYVKDSYGDGISGGYIRLYDANNNMLFSISATSFSSEVNAMVSVGTVNIDEATSDDNMLIFPNPTSDVVNIQTAQQIQQIELYNLQGQRVALQTGNTNTISLSEMATGLYILKVTTDQGVSTYKVSKR